MSLLIPKLMLGPGVLRAKDKDVLCQLLSSAAATMAGRHKGVSGLEEKSKILVPRGDSTKSGLGRL
jgi:hypothetical protein